MPAWLAKAIAFVLQLLAGPAAAREAGRQEQAAETATDTIATKDAQLEIAARPDRTRDQLLDRMRDGQL
jgi:hypothetical protein